jgi:hypothetical protein
LTSQIAVVRLEATDRCSSAAVHRLLIRQHRIQEEFATSAAEPIRQSDFSWLLNALGLQYAIPLPLAGLFCFLLALTPVLRGKGPIAGAGLMLFVHVPPLIGVFAAMEHLRASYSVNQGSLTTPNPSALAEADSSALVAPMVGMVLMVPGCATAAFGASNRSFGADSAQRSPNH